MRNVELDVLAQRAGSSNRTADELASVFIEDVAGIILAMMERGAIDPQPHVVIPDDVTAAMADANLNGWCEEDYSAETLSDFIPTCESWLSDFAMVAIWDDGYTIYTTDQWDDATWEEVDG